MSMQRIDQQLGDNPPSDQAEGNITTKFWTLGLVTSRKWNSTYINVSYGRLNLYDSRESCISNPHTTVLSISLGKNHRVSEIKRKNYSKDNMKVIDFFCFYVEIDNGIFDVTRVLKIGCVNELQARAIANCIKYNIGPPAYDNFIPPSRS